MEVGNKLNPQRSYRKGFALKGIWQHIIIKGSTEPTHGSVYSDVRKLQSMDVLELQSTKADWNTKCHFHILAYIYSNVLDISTSYFIEILSCRERLDLDSQRTKKCTFPLDFRGEQRKQRKVNLWNFEEWFYLHINTPLRKISRSCSKVFQIESF